MTTLELFWHLIAWRLPFHRGRDFVFVSPDDYETIADGVSVEMGAVLCVDRCLRHDEMRLEWDGWVR